MTALEAEVAQLKAAVGGMAAQAALPARVDRTEAEIARVAVEVAAVGQMRADIAALKEIVLQPRFGLLDSLIIAEFPPLFDESPRKHFKLLWRSSRDSFRAKEFHRRCDGRANTLTLIADIEGNVFGGFTPVEWESGNQYNGDDSLRSFFFTLRNPHGVPPRKFALRAEKKQRAIICNSIYRTIFGYSDHTRIGSHWRGHTDATDTAENFRVKEIEVFEIAD
jgi:hypothetical protein